MSAVANPAKIITIRYTLGLSSTCDGRPISCSSSPANTTVSRPHTLPQWKTNRKGRRRSNEELQLSLACPHSGCRNRPNSGLMSQAKLATVLLTPSESRYGISKLSPTVQPTCTAAAGRQRQRICQRDRGGILSASLSSACSPDEGDGERDALAGAAVDEDAEAGGGRVVVAEDED